jgi:hypothetical protein
MSVGDKVIISSNIGHMYETEIGIALTGVMNPNNGEFEDSDITVGVMKTTSSKIRHQIVARCLYEGMNILQFPCGPYVDRTLVEEYGNDRLHISALAPVV